MISPAVPPWAYAAALAGLPYLPWHRLVSLLRDGEPAEAWDRVRSGAAGEAWARAARAVAVEEVARAHRAAGVAVHLLGRPGYPPPLAGDHQAPAVLFSLGSLDVLHGPRVGVVGTRRCTGYGRDVARRLGRDLSEAGVAVVSGLALGIDGAAHHGALAGGGGAPVGVVAGGLDVVYPSRHRELWYRVAQAGVLVSEAPVGTRPEAWRFPARNRLIAALSQVVVVVESDHAGGSMHTVRAAEERGTTVMAVPGPVCSPASAGTNQLLSDGCAPARDATDVLVALALDGAAPRPRPDCRRPPGPEEASVLEALGWTPASVEQLLARTGLPLGRVAVALARLDQDGWVRGSSGWWEQVRAP